MEASEKNPLNINRIGPKLDKIEGNFQYESLEIIYERGSEERHKSKEFNQYNKQSNETRQGVY